MISRWLLLMLLCWAINSDAQVVVKGRITDGQQDLPSATVLLLHTDSSVVKGVMTDGAGRFTVENVAPDRYLISSSMVGYAKFTSEPFSIGDTDKTIPDIILREASTGLSEVVIEGEKPLFEQQIDRTIVNVQSSITSAGNTIIEVLQKSPGVIVNRQNSTISLNGKSPVRVMIDGKLMQLPLDVVIPMLDGMSSANIEKIELINAPPARYDADGSGGIIHIVTKTNTDLGTNASYGLMAGARWAEALGINFNINHRSGKFSYFIDYSINRNHNRHIFSMTRESRVAEDFVNAIRDNSKRENLTTQQNLNVGLEWQLTKRTSLNFLLTGYRRNWDLTALNHDINEVTADSTINTSMQITESNIWQSATAAIGLQTKINEKSDLSVSVDYLYYNNDNPSSYDNHSIVEQSGSTDASKIDLTKRTPINFFIAKADYQFHVSPELTIETGIKGVTSTLDNNVLVRRLVNDVWTLDPAFTSYSNLHEQIGAAYVSSNWQIANQWQLNTGVRYEYTHTSISTPTQKNIINRKYGYFFPNLFIKRELGSERDVQFSYTRRITRPTYNDIAPYVFFWGPNTFSGGNTALLPAVTDAFKVGYHLNQWVVSFQVSHAKKEIVIYQPELDSQTNNFIYRSENLKYLNTYSLSNSYSSNITAWWEIQSTVAVQYQEAQTQHLKQNTMLYLYGVNLNMVNTLKLPKEFAIEVSGFYQSKTLSGISYFLFQASLNVGIQKKLGEKGTLKLAMDDILNTNYWKIKTDSQENNLNSYFKYNFHNQFIRLSYSRNLGNSKLRSVKVKSGSEDERRRVN